MDYRAYKRRKQRRAERRKMEDASMEMLDDGYYHNTNDLQVQYEPVSGKDYLKMSMQNRNAYHQKMVSYYDPKSNKLSAPIAKVQFYRWHKDNRIYPDRYELNVAILNRMTEEFLNHAFTRPSDFEMQRLLDDVSRRPNKHYTPIVVNLQILDDYGEDGKMAYVMKMYDKNSKYASMDGKIYKSYNDIADAMNDLDNLNKPKKSSTKTKSKVSDDDWHRKIAKSEQKQLEQLKAARPVYEKKAEDIYKLIQYAEDHNMYESVFDASRVQKKHVEEVIAIYKKILTPSDRDEEMLIQALDHMAQHLAIVIKSFKEKQSDDLEVYRNFLGMKFNLKGLFG